MKWTAHVLADTLGLETISEMLIIAGAGGLAEARLRGGGQGVGVARVCGIVPGKTGVAEAGHGRAP